MNFEDIPLETKENSSIRLKITQKCPWDCLFCHEEGGWGIDDMQWDESMQKNISILKMYDDYYSEQDKYQKVNHYSALWSQRKIYSR